MAIISLGFGKKTRDGMEKKQRNEIKCAIYVRKSTTEGLDSDFSSLDSQENACRAYIQSQKTQGWVALPNTYRDGGFTGANTDRPALKQLLADVEASQIDVITISRLDRISRSLFDFLKIMDFLESKNVSLVSVTQRIDTSSSMGKLMLHVLSSFSEYERRLIGERTADKMRSAKKQGRWCGGMLPLGYNLMNGQLVVEKREASQVETAFHTYLKTESLRGTVQELNKLGIKTKRWKTSKGHERGGTLFSKNALHRLLRNPVYLGRVSLNGQIYEGVHDGIVDEIVFRKANALLIKKSCTGNTRKISNSLLRGLLHCSNCSCLMTPSSSKKKNKIYRYFTCGSAMRNGWSTCPSPSLPASEIEQFVIREIKCAGQDPVLRRAVLKQVRIHGQERRKELQIEKRGLERQLQQLYKGLQKAATRGTQAPTSHITETLERIRELEAKAGQVKVKLEALCQNQPGEQHIGRLLEQFDELWEALTPKEQAEVLRLLVKKVSYDGKQGSVTIEFHQTGLTALTGQMSEEEAA